VVSTYNTPPTGVLKYDVFGHQHQHRVKVLQVEQDIAVLNGRLDMVRNIHRRPRTKLKPVVLLFGRMREAECLRNELRQECRVAQRGQLDLPDGIVVSVSDRAGNLQCQAGLATATQAGEANKARCGEQAFEV
jgi:hypothetical protein